MELVNMLVEYIESTYKVKPEHPWAKYPEDMTFKETYSKKWFALIMITSRKSLGLDGSENVYIVNVKADSQLISMLSQSEGYMPGYHMNKQHWLTILLDGSVAFDQIITHIDNSYSLISDTPTKRIYEAVKLIPRGKVATYGKVAELAGDRKMARAVGNALHKNPDPDNIPCYRVVNSKGELSGEFAFGGDCAQAKLLINDGIEVIDGKVDLSIYSM